VSDPESKPEMTYEEALAMSMWGAGLALSEEQAAIVRRLRAEHPEIIQIGNAGDHWFNRYWEAYQKAEREYEGWKLEFMDRSREPLYREEPSARLDPSMGRAGPPKPPKSPETAPEGPHDTKEDTMTASIAPIPAPTVQEAFDTIRAHFAKPEACYSIDFQGDCQYRGPNGAKCAFGVLIPDEYYDKGWEGKTSTWVMDLAPDLFADWQYGLRQFIAKVQRMHDWCAGEDKPIEVFLAKLDAMDLSEYEDEA